MNSKIIPHTALDELNANGQFVRTMASFRNWISSDPGSQFPPEKGRYHLYVSYACPWAHRTLLVRSLKKLESVISVTIVHPIWQRTRPEVDEHVGWFFGDPKGKPVSNSAGIGGPFPPVYKGTEPNPFENGSKTIREIYEYSKDVNGKYSVPILWDTVHKTIVSNESSEIIRMLNKEFNGFSERKELDLYPEGQLRSEIDLVNEWVYSGLNNGVYKCGFAKTQNAYDQAIKDLTACFDRIENLLKTKRYLVGNVFTEADIRLFVTLLRFDEIYTVVFKTNTRFVSNSPALLNYCREIYQMDGVADTVNMEHCKVHYFCSHPSLNHFAIVPKGNDFESLLKMPHNRANLES